MSHFEQRLEADLQEIRDLVWAMGDAVQVALGNAVKNLILRDEALAYATVLGDSPINRDSRACDRLCHRFIARHLPGAGHLREMASTIRVNVALERIGDYAVTICREGLQLSGPLSENFLEEIEALADESIHILDESRSAFRSHNAELAKALIPTARRIQNRMDGFYEELFAEDDRMDAPTMLAIFVIFNLLKRVADQAKNICDQAIYAVSGVAKIPKTHRFLFLAEAGSGMGHLAAAIGRKNHADSSEFVCATTGPSEPPPPAMKEFMEQTGLPVEDLVSEQTSLLEHDFADFEVIISLSGMVRDYLDKIPFHTSALNWLLPGEAGTDDYSSLYRFLQVEISQLMSIIVGEETG